MKASQKTVAPEDIRILNVVLDGVVAYEIICYFLEHHPCPISGSLLGVPIGETLHINGWLPSPSSLFLSRTSSAAANPAREAKRLKEAMLVTREEVMDCGYFQVNHFGLQFSDALLQTLHEMHASVTNGIFLSLDTTRLAQGSVDVAAFRLSKAGEKAGRGALQLGARAPFVSKLLSEIPAKVQFSPAARLMLATLDTVPEHRAALTAPFSPALATGLNVAERIADRMFVSAARVEDISRRAARAKQTEAGASQWQTAKIAGSALVAGETLRQQAARLRKEATASKQLAEALKRVAAASE